MRCRWLVPFAALLAGAYTTALRPWLLNWGATEGERRCPLPGDDLVPDPGYQTTRAITIRAPASAIWRWLAQMGQDRAGFYTHNWVERLLLSGIPDTRAIHPEWQALRVGDLARTNRELRAGHPLGWPVALVAPDRALVLTSKALPAGTYAFVLDPLGADTTRLLCRDRAVVPWQQRPFIHLLYEPLHAYMQTGLLRGIKARAEQESSPTG